MNNLWNQFHRRSFLGFNFIKLRTKRAYLSLIVIVLLIIIHDIEEPQLIHSFARAYHSQIIPQLLSLQVLLCPTAIVRSNRNQSSQTSNIQILQISPRKLYMRNDFHLPIPLLADLHRIAKIPHTAIHLDLVV